MPDREIILEDVASPNDLFLLKEYLRDLYRLLDPTYETKAFSATPTFDLDETVNYRITLTGNITGITLKNPHQGRRIRIVFLQDNTGSRTVAGWPANVKLSGAAFAVTATANAASAITLLYDGTNFYEVARALDLR